MKNQNTQEQETSLVQAKKGNTGKGLSRIGLGFGIITICLMISACTSSSRPSTPSEIAAQKEFQEKLNTAQEEYQQKVDTATKEAGERQMELHKKLNTAQEEFLRKLDAEKKEEKQKSDSIGK